MSSDDEPAVTDEPDAAAHLRAAADHLDDARTEMSEAIGHTDFASTAGVTAAYRAEASGLASRLRGYADLIDSGTHPEGDTDE